MLRYTVALTLTFLSIAAPASAALSTGHAGWLWGTPEPQGNNLHALEMQGNLGFAAGDFGTLVRTADGGGTWDSVRTGLTMDFRRIDVIDADSFVVGSDCALRRTDDGGATFSRLPFTASESRCARRIRAISFPTANVGYVLLEDGGLLRTSDGGRSFTPLTISNDSAAAATAIAFSDAANGLATTATGKIFRTVNAGGTWTLEHDGTVGLNALYTSGTTAVAVGQAGTFLVSTNGGDTWTDPGTAPDAQDRPAVAFQSVRCAGTSCLMGANGTLWRTGDLGRTFAVVNTNVNAADFVSATRAVAVGLYGETDVSTTEGATWARVGNRLSVPSITRIRATSTQVAYAAGERGTLVRTGDGGESWVDVGVITGEDVRDVAFPSPAVGYALDSAGGLFRTDNAGTTWSVLQTEFRDVPQSLFAPDEATVLVIGPRGMFRSTDEGETFDRHRHKVVRDRTLVEGDDAGSAVVVHGPRVIAMSTNNGRTWRRIVRPTQKSEVRDVDFVSAKVGYVLETDGRVYRTTDGGKTWADLIALGRSNGAQLAFGGKGSGWLSLAEFPSTVLRTNNGGKSWRPQVLTPTGAPLIAAGGPRTAFASVGTPGFPAIVFTHTGGDLPGSSDLRLSTRTRTINRARTVTVTGNLSPARGGERVDVFVRSLNGSRWRTLEARVSSDGDFSVERRIRSSSVFVAQWAGDGQSAGSGSRALVVTRVRR